MEWQSIRERENKDNVHIGAKKKRKKNLPVCTGSCKYNSRASIDTRHLRRCKISNNVSTCFGNTVFEYTI